jgi:hypothetical protein
LNEASECQDAALLVNQILAPVTGLRGYLNQIATACEALLSTPIPRAEQSAERLVMGLNASIDFAGLAAQLKQRH